MFCQKPFVRLTMWPPAFVLLLAPGCWSSGDGSSDEVDSAGRAKTSSLADSEAPAGSPDSQFDVDLLVNHVGSSDEPLSSTELAQLWKLREQPPAVRVQVLRRYLESESAAKRFNRRVAYITHAAVGLDEAVRGRVARELVRPALDLPGGPAAQKAVAALGLELRLIEEMPKLATLTVKLRLPELLAADPTDRTFPWKQSIKELAYAGTHLPEDEALAAFRKLDQAHVDPSFIREIREDLQPAFASRLPASQAGQLVRDWLRNPDDDRTTYRNARAAAPRIDDSVAREVVDAILSRAAAREEIKEFSAIGIDAIERFDASVTADYSVRVVSAMTATDNVLQRHQLARMLTKLPGKLPPAAGLQALENLAQPLASKNRDTTNFRSELIVAKLPPQAYPSAFETLLKQLAAVNREDYESAAYLRAALNHIAENAPPETAEELARRIYQRRADEKDRPSYLLAVHYLQKIIGKLPREQLHHYTQRAVKTELSDNEDTIFVAAVLRGASTRPEEFSREERFHYADKFIRWAEQQQAAAEGARYKRAPLVAALKGLKDTCQVLAHEDFAKAYQRMTVLFDKPKFAHGKMISVYGLTGLASSLPSDERTPVIEQFVGILDASKYHNDDVNMLLISWLTGAAKEMSPEQAGRAIPALLRQLPKYNAHDRGRLLTMLDTALDARPTEEVELYLAAALHGAGNIVVYDSPQSLEQFLQARMAKAPRSAAYELAGGIVAQMTSGEKARNGLLGLHAALVTLRDKLTDQQRGQIAQGLAEGIVRHGTELAKPENRHDQRVRIETDQQLLQTLVEFKNDLPPDDAVDVVNHVVERFGEHNFKHYFYLQRLAAFLARLTETIPKNLSKPIEQRLLERLKNVPRDSVYPGASLIVAVARLPGKMDPATAEAGASVLGEVIENVRHEKNFVELEEPVAEFADESGDKPALILLAAVLENITKRQKFTNSLAAAKLVPHVVADLSPAGQRAAWSNTLSRLDKLTQQNGKNAAAKCLTEITGRLEPADVPMVLEEIRSPLQPEVTTALSSGLSKLAAHQDNVKRQIENELAATDDQQRRGHLERVLQARPGSIWPTFDVSQSREQLLATLKTTTDERTFYYIVSHLTKPTDRLEPTELWTLLDYPNCVGSARSIVLSKLRQRNGDYTWSLWDFVTRAEEIGLNKD